MRKFERDVFKLWEAATAVRVSSDFTCEWYRSHDGSGMIAICVKWCDWYVTRQWQCDQRFCVAWHIRAMASV